MRVTIEGYELPGRTFCDSNGDPYDDVRVGVQIRKDPEELVPADADTARWELDVTVATGPDDSLDFKGPAVHGERGDRFLYLTWGNIDGNGDFDMFRRAKLMLNRIDPEPSTPPTTARTSSWDGSDSATTSEHSGAPESTHPTSPGLSPPPDQGVSHCKCFANGSQRQGAASSGK